MRYGMVIDLKRCIGCYGCQIACKSENATPPDIDWSRVLFYEAGQYPAVRKMPLPVLCMHCEVPSCVEVCPTAASVKRPDGIVTTDSQKCTGCLNCVLACPYGARDLFLGNREHFPGQGLTPFEQVGYQRHQVGAVGKCDFCLSRIENGLKPACVDSCMARARYFGDLDDANSEVSQLVRDGEAFHICPGAFPGTSEANVEIKCSVYYLRR